MAANERICLLGAATSGEAIITGHNGNPLLATAKVIWKRVGDEAHSHELAGGRPHAAESQSHGFCLDTLYAHWC